MKLAVPGTVIAPVCVMAPPVVTFRFLPLVNVMTGNEIPALFKVIVKFDAPLIAPPNTMEPEPAPPIVVSLPSVIGLFKVMLEPDSVSAPVPPMPVPFKVNVLAFAKVALLKLRSNAAFAATLVLLELPRAPALVKLNLPTLIEVAPE